MIDWFWRSGQKDPIMGTGRRRNSELAWVLTNAYVLLTTVLVHAQDQSGFVSIDCGSTEEYTDSVTGINYVPDTNYIDSGERRNIANTYNDGHGEKQFENVRTFPIGVRNCYTLRFRASSVNGTKFLIRARFMYGNYDSKNQAPEFDLYVGVNLWTTIKISGMSNLTTVEMIYVSLSNATSVCLVNKGLGTPFISVLETRVLNNGAYITSMAGPLILVTRANLVSGSSTKYRYPDDVYDRIWEPKELSGGMSYISTNQTLRNNNIYRTPRAVMQTAVTSSKASGNIEFLLETTKSPLHYYTYMHITELQNLSATNQTREFKIYLTKDFLFFGPFSPWYLDLMTLWAKDVQYTAQFNFTLSSTGNSTLPPLLNAFEIYIFDPAPQYETDATDVGAINAIKSNYGISKLWQGDPCAPQNYSWEGLSCSFNGYEPPRITAINLSSSNLMGPITDLIADLKSLQHLDLSQNKLSGSVPEFFSSLKSLKYLNLSGNNLMGTIPASLVNRLNEGSLALSVEGNPNLCVSDMCNSQKNSNVVVPVVSSVGGVIGFLLVLLVILHIYRKKRSKEGKGSKFAGSFYLGGTTRDVLKPNKQRFTYSEILIMTRNFEKVIGVGGFGTVHHGTLDGTQVAVKMLSPSSTQGYKEFEAEAQILTRVHHRNLTSLIGYCDEGDKLGLIYEYMANGNLGAQISANDSHYFIWEDRLHIAIDAAQGLDYLHNGCKPPIVHRDVKSANILLNECFQAKLADFGLSRVYPADGQVDHVSTTVVGTLGYLDPEYYSTERLTEKSDVYSFGVVLLEIITSQPMRTKTQERTHIATWVNEILCSTGDLKSIVDHRLRGDYDINSVWQAIELAMACVSPTSNRRPGMGHVVSKLKQCLDMEKARKIYEGCTQESVELSSNDFLELDPSSEQPLAR